MQIQNENLNFQVLKSDFVKTTVTLKELIQDIRQSCTAQNELDEAAIVVRSKINYLKEQIDNLVQIAQEQDRLEQRNILQDEINQWKKQLQDIHIAFRNILLTTQLNITQMEKDELFSYKSNSETDENSLRHRGKMSREMMMKNSSQLTDDLLTVTRMLRLNTEKSTKTIDTLVQSSETVTATQEELKTMGSVIGQAKKILNKYGRRENTDKLLIFLGLILFLASCLVVIRNRF